MAKVVLLVIVFLSVPGYMPWLLIASMLLLLGLADAGLAQLRRIGPVREGAPG
jgi:hypothetical protein